VVFMLNNQHVFVRGTDLLSISSWRIFVPQLSSCCGERGAHPRRCSV
jgi:hypothetical protein